MKLIVKNRRAFYDYEIIKRITAGISLAGHEVKSIRSGQISLKGSFIHFQNNEAYLVNAHIRRYNYASNVADYNPTRPRKLLFHRKEINYLEGQKRSAGLAVIPLAVGLEHGLIKVEIALGRGKKHYDKREASRKKTMRRDAILETKRKLST